MKLKKILVIALGVFTLLSNTVTVKAERQFIRPPVPNYTKDLIKHWCTDLNISFPNHAINKPYLSPKIVYEVFNFGSSGYNVYSDILKKFSKPDDSGYITTTVTLIPSKKYSDPKQYYNIYDEETLNSYKEAVANNLIPYKKQIVLSTQLVDSYTGINLMSGLEDYTDKNGVEYKNACVFKSKGKRYIVQVQAKQTEPTKKNPFGTLEFKVRHHKSYKGLVIAQYLGYEAYVPKQGTRAFAADPTGNILNLDYSKRFDLKDFYNGVFVYGRFYNVMKPDGSVGTF